MDLIVDGERWWLIDVNPRPGASFELHEGESSLVQAHTDVFEGRALRLPRPPAGALRGHRIVYAGCPLTVPPQIRWPDWVCDRPWPGTRIGPGEPVCSVQASAASSAAARMLLEARLQRMKALLVRWQDHRESA